MSPEPTHSHTTQITLIQPKATQQGRIATTVGREPASCRPPDWQDEAPRPEVLQATVSQPSGPLVGAAEESRGVEPAMTPARNSTPEQSAPLRSGVEDQASVGKLNPKINARPVHNRIFGVMMHTSRYAFKAQARLAADCQVAPSTVSRLVTGQSSPSFSLVAAITTALEKQLRRSIDPRELVSPNGDYPTPYTCELCGCHGCLPDEAYDEHDRLRPEYENVRPGQWTTLSSHFIKQALAEQELEQDKDGVVWALVGKETTTRKEAVISSPVSSVCGEVQ